MVAEGGPQGTLGLVLPPGRSRSEDSRLSGEARFWGLVAQTVKHLPAVPETQVRFLGQEDPLEKEMAIHSSTLAWKIPWMEEPDRLQSMGSQRVGHDFTFTGCTARGPRAGVRMLVKWGRP